MPHTTTSLRDDGTELRLRVTDGHVDLQVEDRAGRITTFTTSARSLMALLRAAWADDRYGCCATLERPFRDERWGCGEEDFPDEEPLDDPRRSAWDRYREPWVPPPLPPPPARSGLPWTEEDEATMRSMWLAADPAVDRAELLAGIARAVERGVGGVAARLPQTGCDPARPGAVRSWPPVGDAGTAADPAPAARTPLTLVPEPEPEPEPGPAPEPVPAVGSEDEPR
jgi:hypothetical protein